MYATFLTLYLFLFTSCKQEDETIVSQPQPHEEEFTVAVVAPIGDAATKLRLERTAQWFAENFLQAQQSDTLLYSLLIEWHDEQHEDLATLSRELARRDDIVAIVGPFGNEPAAQFAAACQQTHKPLIAPTATSEELSRRYAVSTLGSTGSVNKQAFFWPLCETDIVLAETMLGHYATTIGHYAETTPPNTAMFAPADAYGQTFFDWMPFHAQNMNIELKRNVQYDTTEGLLSAMRAYLKEMCSDVETNLLSNSFCVVESSRQLRDVIRDRIAWFVEMGGSPVSEIGGETYESVYRSWFVFPGLSQEKLNELGEDDV